MNRIITVIGCLFVAGCNSAKPELIRTEWKVVIPDVSMYDCPTLKSLPKVSTLTDIQVAKLIVTLYKNNERCKNSMEAIKTFLTDAEKRVSEQSRLP